MTTPESWFFLLRHYIYHYRGKQKKNQGNYLQDCAKFTFKGMKRIKISICWCRIQVRSLTFVNQHTCISKIRTFFFFFSYREREPSICKYLVIMESKKCKWALWFEHLMAHVLKLHVSMYKTRIYMDNNMI